MGLGFRVSVGFRLSLGFGSGGDRGVEVCGFWII